MKEESDSYSLVVCADATWFSTCGQDCDVVGPFLSDENRVRVSLTTIIWRGFPLLLGPLLVLLMTSFH